MLLCLVAWKIAGWSKEGDAWDTGRISFIPVCFVRVQQMGSSSGERNKRGPGSRDQEAEEVLAWSWPQVTDHLYVHKKRQCRSEPWDYQCGIFLPNEWHEVDGFEKYRGPAGNAPEVRSVIIASVPTRAKISTESTKIYPQDKS